MKLNGMLKNINTYLSTFKRRTRNWLVLKLIGKDIKVIMNITVTSDIISYNKLDLVKGDILLNNHIKQVNSRQSFVYNPTAGKQYNVS